MAKKMTRKEALQTAIEIMVEWQQENFGSESLAGSHTEEAVRVIEKMIESIDKQAARPRAKSSTRIQNEGMAKELITALKNHNEPVNTKWISEHVRFATTSQKAVAIAKIAIEWGEVKTVKIKNRTYYAPIDWEPAN